MKGRSRLSKWVFVVMAFAFGLWGSGCASPPEAVSPWPSQYPFRSTSLLDKVWLKEGFDFSGYDTLYIAETRLEAKAAEPRDEELLTQARRALRDQLQSDLRTNGIFKAVSVNESDPRSGDKTLVLEPSIVAFRKGSRAVRFWVGFGAGMPAMVIRGRFAERGGLDPLCIFEMQAAGEEVAGYVFGEFIDDKELQLADIRGLTHDLADFIRKVARHEKIQYKK